jgi:hypothetical protein
MFTMKMLQECSGKLLSNGWTEEVSRMSNYDDGRFGICFQKDGAEFWLNNRTYKQLPEEL